MKICSNCNKEFDDEFNFCPFCGSQYGKIECPNCHKLLNKASPFCGYCGHELIIKESDIKENNPIFQVTYSASNLETGEESPTPQYVTQIKKY